MSQVPRPAAPRRRPARLRRGCTERAGRPDVARGGGAEWTVEPRAFDRIQARAPPEPERSGPSAAIAASGHARRRSRSRRDRRDLPPHRAADAVAASGANHYAAAMEPNPAFSRPRGGGHPPEVRPEASDGALALLRRLPPEAQRAAAALAMSPGARSEHVLRQITRLLLAADLDAALDGLAQGVDFGVRPETMSEAEIEEAAIGLTAVRP